MISLRKCRIDGRGKAMAELTWQDQQLQDAIEKLGEGDRNGLAAAIGKRNCHYEWFAEPEVVEKAWSWIQTKKNESPGLEVPPRSENDSKGILSLESALKPLR
jgi:hypothetical protein